MPELLEPPVAPETDPIDAEVVGEQDAPQEVPSVMAVTTRYIVGKLAVTQPAEDGSRVLRLVSGNEQTVVEVNLSPQLCTFAALKLMEIEVITEDDEKEESADGPDAPGTD